MKFVLFFIFAIVFLLVVYILVTAFRGKEIKHKLYLNDLKEKKKDLEYELARKMAEYNDSHEINEIQEQINELNQLINQKENH